MADIPNHPRREQMKTNVGGIDRILRIVIGLALVAWAAFFNGPVWAWIGILPLATGLMGSCLLYSLIGVNTCPTKK
jgi:hypothetical protein